MLAVSEVGRDVRATRVEIPDLRADTDIRRDFEVETAADVEDARIRSVTGGDIGLAEVGKSATGNQVR